MRAILPKYVTGINLVIVCSNGITECIFYLFQIVLQVKKLQDRVQKSKDDVQKAKEKYEAALDEINGYNPKYMEDMTVVFDKCQDMEAQRLQFFKEIMFSIHKCLNISQDPV
jgi:DNA-binding transcriptional regulator GbsR (MarR family)